MVINKMLDDLIEEFDIISFLFVESGISRRYYNLPDWIGLLKQMVKQFNDNPFAFRFYEDTVSFRETPYGLNPAIASLIEEDYNREWFKNNSLWMIII